MAAVADIVLLSTGGACGPPLRRHVAAEAVWRFDNKMVPTLLVVLLPRITGLAAHQNVRTVTLEVQVVIQLLCLVLLTKHCCSAALVHSRMQAHCVTAPEIRHLATVRAPWRLQYTEAWGSGPFTVGGRQANSG